jgi:predicted lipoprotein with Yx(FWY)xxD motif
MRWRLIVPLALASIALTATGCGAESTEATAPAAETAAPHEGHAGHSAQAAPQEGHAGHSGATAPQEGHAGHHGGQPQLWAVQTGPLGVVVGDESELMLYRSDLDSANPPTSRCVGACAEQWPPVIVAEGQMPELLGIDQAAIGTVRRDDGQLQLTLAGWPLYRHTGDRRGFVDTGGHGTDGKWFVVTPKGEKAQPS